jgi:short-subunit dehydrogenase
MPGAFNLIYNSTKAFIDDFCVGLANELKHTPVVITCLLPGGTDTQFFERADMEKTKLGQADKADPAKVALDGYQALLKGETQEVSGLMNKVQAVFADILPAETVAQMHRRMAKPRG